MHWHINMYYNHSLYVPAYKKIVKNVLLSGVLSSIDNQGVIR